MKEKVQAVFLFLVLTVAATVIVVSVLVLPEAIAMRLEDLDVDFAKCLIGLIALVLLASIGALVKTHFEIRDERERRQRQIQRRRQQASDSSWESIFRSHYGL